MDANTRRQLKAIEKLRLPELQARFADIVGEQSRSPNRVFLLRRIAAALEAQAAANPGAEPGETVSTSAATSGAATAGAPTSADDATRAAASATAARMVPPATPRRPGRPSRQDAATSATGQPHAGRAGRTASAASAAHAGRTARAGRAGRTTRAAGAASATDASGAERSGGPTEPRLSRLSIEELQARYAEVVGRPTNSQHSGYLQWKIRQAQNGHIRVGPARQRSSDNPADMKVLPLRMETSVVDQLDAARQRLGLASRTDLFRRALQLYLKKAGEPEVAALFAAEAEA